MTINLLTPIIDDNGAGEAIAFEEWVAAIFTGNQILNPDALQAFWDTTGIGHIVSETTIGQLETSSHKANGDAFFGAGNSTAHYLNMVDYTSNIEFGLENHYRTGDYVTPVAFDRTTGVPNPFGDPYIVTMDKGIQNGLHNEQGVNTARSAASVDLSMNFGTHGPQDGEFVLTVNSHDYRLEHSGANWFFADAAHNPVQGLTLSPDGHVLQDSANLAFFSSILQHNANPADLKAQYVHIALTEMATEGTGADAHVVGVAQIAETIHLV